MIPSQNFFQHIRESLFKKLTDSQVTGMEAIIKEADRINLPIKQLAYCLATAYHETAATMQPIEEYGKGRKLAYGKRLKMSRQPYFDTANIFYGRGFVQLTWYENYEKASKKCGVNFIKEPEKVMEMKYAVQILFEGMITGWFTGRKLSTYINEDITDFKNARRIINGTDKADMIEEYATHFLKALN